MKPHKLDSAYKFKTSVVTFDIYIIIISKVVLRAWISSGLPQNSEETTKNNIISGTERR